MLKVLLFVSYFWFGKFTNMWRFISSQSLGDSVSTDNEHTGRQVWVYDEKNVDKELNQKVEEARSRFTQNRYERKHNSDTLLRLQQEKQLERPLQYYNDNQRVQIIQHAEDVNKGKASYNINQVQDALKAGISYFSAMQTDEGFWPGDYGGPMFLMPGLVIALYVVGILDIVLSSQHKLEMIRYLKNHQNQDGGYGLHIEGESTMFGTVLSYVCMRLLGLGVKEKECQIARKWIMVNGGATQCTSWGKFWLCLLGAYSYDGVNPMPPEMWLLPYSKWSLIGWMHPGRMWCHCRMVYLPMSHLYGKRYHGPITQLVKELRNELYVTTYDKIDWNKARSACAKVDLYYPRPFVQDVLWWALYNLEWLFFVPPFSWLRKLALKETMKQIKYEDKNTNFLCIGPVSKAINLVCAWLDDPTGSDFQHHVQRIKDYLWIAEDGMRMQAYNGSQVWDAAFAVQAFAQANMKNDTEKALKKAVNFLDKSQVQHEDDETARDRHYRDSIVGGFPFSTADQRWIVTDCTSEGVEAALSIEHAGIPTGLDDKRYQNSVDLLLNYHNKDDQGWATYELRRSSGYLELVNPSETFGDIVVDYSCVECSTSTICALNALQQKLPKYRTQEIQDAIRKGIEYVKRVQREDGSWYGSWGVCFTYGCMFGNKSLAAANETYANSLAQKKSCHFLLSKQREDGGWSESYLSCQNKEYTELQEETSTVVNTAWAMLALIAAEYDKYDAKPLHRAAACLIKQQEKTGDWPQQHISGVFNRNCTVTYMNFRNIFPIWALGWYQRIVLSGESVQNVIHGH